jgi:MinD-like ATPase involved in chromosome partitioning or flagellar assembly
MPHFGQIITFYSYKGGTGRSMALANVACLLATKGRDRVLMIDWDLEAPGLHEYFRNSSRQQPGPGDIPDESPGVIELFRELDLAANRDSSQADNADWVRELIYNFDFSKYIIPTKISNLSIIKAGRFDPAYHLRVNSFEWQKFYNQLPLSFLHLSEYFCERFDYILVDSRTGETDISGICTRLLPSKLVVVFVPNRQSINGAVEIVQRATNYRKNSADVRPLVAFPLVSRVDNSEYELRQLWRFGDPEQDVPGYQRTFETLFKRIYDLETCDLEEHFNEVQIQYVPRFAYGEETAVLSERGEDRLSLTRSYAGFADRLIALDHPWDDFQSHGRYSGIVSEHPTYDEKFDIPGEFRKRPLESALELATSSLYGIGAGGAAFLILTAFGLGTSSLGISTASLLFCLCMIFISAIRYFQSSAWRLRKKLERLRDFRRDGLISEDQCNELTVHALGWEVVAARTLRRGRTPEALKSAPVVSVVDSLSVLSPSERSSTSGDA